MPTIEISDETWGRLKSLAVPLEDTNDTVLNRLMDRWENLGESFTDTTAPKPRPFDAFAPPDLTHTRVHELLLNGSVVRPKQWNKLLIAVIEAAAKAGATTQELWRLMPVNAEPGQRTDSGFRYVEEANLSYQGQDANGAWNACAYIARHYGFKICATFEWRQNPRAAYPGVTGQFSVGHGA